MEDKIARVFDAQLARGLHHGASIAVVRGDRLVYVRSGGYADARHKRPVRDSTPFLLFSGTKAFVATAIHKLADEGKLDLAAPVARYWPEFGRHGKEEITPLDLLLHRAGLEARASLFDLVSWLGPRPGARRIAGMRPATAPGAKCVYHTFTAHIVLGELIRRIDGRTPRRYLEEEFLAPLGLNDCSAGLPHSRRSRASGVFTEDPRQKGPAGVFSLPAFRRVFMPAASMNASARDLARFYAMLLAGGTAAGRRFLSQEAVHRATGLVYDGPDGDTGRRIRWSAGFTLGGYSPFPDKDIRMMGRASTERTFGHAGQGGCSLGWADPDAGLAFGFVCNGLLPGEEAHRRFEELSDAVRAAFS